MPTRRARPQVEQFESPSDDDVDWQGARVLEHDQAVIEELLADEVGDDGVIEAEEEPQSPELPRVPRHVKEISSLASWTVSSSKPGCSVSALRHPSTTLFWQSDGPQPHHLNIHFFKLVDIVGIRLFLDFENDESYTPTKIEFLAGFREGDLIKFGELQLEHPRGWIWVDLSETGRTEWVEGEEWPVLRCMLLQVRIVENHQNGKDTHLRGLNIFSIDKGTGLKEERKSEATEGRPEAKSEGHRGMDLPAWAMIPELR